jgi:hypothetical protein
MDESKKIIIEERLRTKFPNAYSLFYIVCLMIIGISEFILGILCIIYTTEKYESGSGIWGGAVCLIVALAAILTRIF